MNFTTLHFMLAGFVATIKAARDAGDIGDAVAAAIGAGHTLADLAGVLANEGGIAMPPPPPQP